MNKKILLSTLLALFVAVPAGAASQQESDMALLRNTVQNILNAMVEKGLISADAAQQLVSDAERKANAEVKAIEADQATQPGDVRVTYVPQTVVDQISKEVSTNIEGQVTDNVVARASADGWGVPGALPEWIRNARFDGSVRARMSPVAFASDNIEFSYLNTQRINNAGGIDNLGQVDDAFINTTNDDTLYQLQFRFGGEFDLGDNGMTAFRLATGDPDVPISQNINLSNYNNGSELLVDQAYIRLNTGSERETNHVTFWAGKMPNVWQSTSLIYDVDLRFNGIAAEYDYENRVGTPGPRGAFVTAGIFPLQNISGSFEASGVDDKWLYGAQVGYEFKLSDDGSKASIATAYYNFDNIAGVKSTNPNSNDTDDSVPEYIRKGNTVFGVRDDSVAFTDQIFGLAADFEVINVNGILTWVYEPGFNFDVILDYVENSGYSKGQVFARTGQRIDPKTTGYRAELRAGAPEIDQLWDWNVFGGWEYLERDAVVDGFSDSDFHLGGTDLQGYFIGGDLGLMSNIWVRGRYLSFDEIDEPTLGVDILQIDLNARF